MANPNIAALTTLTGNTTYFTPSGTSAVVLLPNAASSNNVLRVNQIVVANTTASAVAATVAIYTNGSVAQGSAPSGGTAFPVASAISVPANASLIVVDKTTAIYLNEATSITITSGTANALTFSISYELIS
jgi:seryl-tRNA(Sec) selenium transferase